VINPPAFLKAALADRYAIERELGRGGMATVYLARDLKHERRVALKVLHPELAATIGPSRFLQEIRVTSRLQHPHILPVFDSGESSDQLWYTMPFVEGESLRQRLTREKQLAVDAALRITRDVAEALQHAHQHGVVHRDIKPENILLEGEHAVVADFGIARAIDVAGGERLTETGLALGTPAYMSPEQSAGQREVDGRSDIYSLACVLYEMLAGEPPFTGLTPRVVLARHCMDPVPPLSTARPGVPLTLERAVTRALAKVPADRYPGIAEFTAALTDQGAESAARPPRSRRTRWMISGGLVLGIMLLLGLSVGELRQHWRSAGVVTPAGVDPIAYDAYRRGEELLHHRTQGSFSKAIELFTEATRRDSTFARGWAGLARAMGWAREFQWRVSGVVADSLVARQLEASERAMELDSLDPESWLVRAAVSQSVDPTTRNGVLTAVRRALALDPRNDEGWWRLGAALEEVGDPEGAVKSLRRAVALAPGKGHYTAFLSNHFYWQRQYDSAKVWGDSAVAVDPTLPYAREVAGAAALALGQRDAAEADYEASRRLDNGPSVVRALEGLAEVAAQSGDTASALAFIAKAEPIVDSAAPALHSAIALASAYATINQDARALQWLERYQPRRDLHFQLHLRRDLRLDPLRSQAAFQHLLSGAPEPNH
jgi:serine/threonine protein kinase/Tfp pilus assembly protein PilF